MFAEPIRQVFVGKNIDKILVLFPIPTATGDRILTKLEHQQTQLTKNKMKKE